MSFDYSSVTIGEGIARQAYRAAANAYNDSINRAPPGSLPPDTKPIPPLPTLEELVGNKPDSGKQDSGALTNTIVMYGLVGIAAYAIYRTVKKMSK